jgi:site-specific DNA-methyltransferase (adenine-specific)
MSKKYIEMNKIIQGDCLEVMRDIRDKSIDMILCDLPYGTTACRWDTIIPFEPLWEQYKRIIKDNGAIVLTASQPFTSALVMSNIKMFKYDLIWDKKLATGFLNANRMQLRSHEEILVFYKNQPTYNPQKVIGKINHSRGKNKCKTNNLYGYHKLADDNFTELKHPKSVLEFQKEHPSKTIHPTQKPVALFEYLIKTYTNEGDLVLDNCAGSFTTAIASENLKRNWICIEKEAEYCAIGEKRIKENRKRLLNIDKCAKLDI